MDSSRRRPLSDLLGDGNDDDIEEGEYVPGNDDDDDGGDDDDGHMRVHSSESGTGGRHVLASAAPALSAGWAATGRRGCKGGKPPAAVAAASMNSESMGHSSAIVAVQVKPLEPVAPMALAMTNLSGEDDEGSSASASATATATAQPMHYDKPNPPFTGAGARDDRARDRAGPVDHYQLAAAADQAPAPQLHRQAVPVPPPAPAAPKAQLAQQPLAPPPPAAAVQLQQGGQQLVVPRPAPPPREYTCRDCGKTFQTHQGLGGHAAGHKSRQREQEAMAAAMMMPHGGGGEFLAALRRGRKAEEPHACQKCQKVFTTGVALGGHMRMHYAGPPIVHKNKKKSSAALVAAEPPPPPPPPAVTEAELRLALSSTITQMEEPSSSTAPAVAGTGRLRLFGMDIGPLGQQAPSEQQGSSTAEDSSSAGEQQHK